MVTGPEKGREEALSPPHIFGSTARRRRPGCSARGLGQGSPAPVSAVPPPPPTGPESNGGSRAQGSSAGKRSSPGPSPPGPSRPERGTPTRVPAAQARVPWTGRRRWAGSSCVSAGALACGSRLRWRGWLRQRLGGGAKAGGLCSRGTGSVRRGHPGPGGPRCGTFFRGPWRVVKRRGTQFG